MTSQERVRKLIGEMGASTRKHYGGVQDDPTVYKRVKGVQSMVEDIEKTVLNGQHLERVRKEIEKWESAYKEDLISYGELARLRRLLVNSGVGLIYKEEIL